MTYEK
jgi:hypothetical protein